MRVYRDFLRQPYAVRLLGGTLLGRLPTGMALLAIPLYISELGGGYALGGLLLAIYTIGMAVGQPVLGRIMDLRGQPVTLLASAVVAGGGFVVFAASGLSALPVSATAIAVAGLGTPPLEAGLRALWPSVLRDPGEIQAAYSIDAAAQELLFVGGPLLVGGVVILFPQAALVLMAILGVAGAAVVASSRISRGWRSAPRAPDWAGPLRSRGMRVLTAALFFGGAALGPLTIAALAYGGERGLPFAASLLVAVHPLGALTGGLVYGSRSWLGSHGRRFLLLTGGLAVGNLPLVLVPDLPIMLCLTLLSGVFLAPTLACTFTLVDEHAPQGTVTEAFAWVITAMTAGSGLGSAAAGLAADLAGSRGAFAVTGVAGVLTAVLVLAGRRSLSVVTVPASGS